MKLLVTGATGFIGQNLVKRLLDQHISVVMLVRDDSDLSRIDERAKPFPYSGNIETLFSLFESEGFDGVIHLASLFLASHQPEDISELISSNIRFGTELLEASKYARIPWFINTGTFWQHYENAPYNPVNLYAATKQAFEDIAQYYTESSDLVFSTLKLNDTFGPNDTRKKVFNLWYHLSQTGETLEMSPGEQIIDICYIDDVIDAFELLIDHLEHKTFQEQNTAFAIYSNERLSLQELSMVFENAIGKKLNIRWGGRDYREREVMLPPDNLPPLPGWKPKHTLFDAIKKTIGAMA